MRFGLSHLSRACALLGTVAGLLGCVAQPSPYGYGGYTPPTVLQVPAGSGPQAPAVGARHIAVLLPLTGPNADVGQSMLRAAQLALPPSGGPVLDSEDTHGSAEGAASAARAAVAAGAAVIVGPLTAPETAAVAPIARAAGIPVLAFTSDSAQAQPGVWTLGITPAQQVRRLVVAIQGEGRSRIGAILPANAFGDALAGGLQSAVADARLPPPLIVRQPSGANGLNDALSQLASTAGLHGPPGDNPAPPTPAQIDALLLGTSGEPLQQALPGLAGYQTGPDHLRLLGTALWQREAPRLFLIAGAWFAAPDPGPLHAFEQQYAARYGGPPRDLAGFAFDATAVARTVTGPDGVHPEALLRPEGFAGAEGVFVLQADGRVRRALALFEIDRSGAHVAQPPQPPTAPAGF